MVDTKKKPQAGRRKSLASKRLRRASNPPTLLPMSKKPWPHEEFIATLDELSRAAGIPDSHKGTPNTTVFYDWTGVSPTQSGRWRSGDHQPTTESLRMVAYGLAPRAGLDPAKVLATLEIKAGRRRESELVAVTAEPEAAPEAPHGFDDKIRLIEMRLAQKPPTEERRQLERALLRARQARDLGESMLDEALSEHGLA